MAYVDYAQDNRRRATAIAGVTLIHAALGFAVVVGLTVAWTEPVAPPRNPPIFPPTPAPVPTPTPPPDPSPRTTDQTDNEPLPPLPPLPPLGGPTDTPTGGGPTSHEGTGLDSTPPIPPRPAPSFAPKAPVPTNPPGSWISNDDYPARALRAEDEGVAGYRLVVSSQGRVSSCEVTRSTGSRDLDETTCRLISRRARFEAATDETGASVVGSYRGTVRWEIPD